MRNCMEQRCGKAIIMNLYTKYHCLIEKNSPRFNGVGSNGLSIKEIVVTPANYEYLLNRVGALWGWTNRPKYLLEKNALYSRVCDESSRFFLLKKGENLIGYCLATNSSESVAVNFDNLIEIENFGFFPEYTGKGYGGVILNMVFDYLFEEYEHVYLTSRSTNHPKVINFYKRNGMKIIHKDVLPDDLVKDFDYFETVKKSAA